MGKGASSPSDAEASSCPFGQPTGFLTTATFKPTEASPQSDQDHHEQPMGHRHNPAFERLVGANASRCEPAGPLAIFGIQILTLRYRPLIESGLPDRLPFIPQPYRSVRHRQKHRLIPPPPAHPARSPHRSHPRCSQKSQPQQAEPQGSGAEECGVFQGSGAAWSFSRRDLRRCHVRRAVDQRNR